jgi:bacillithiol system protein YtxJ
MNPYRLAYLGIAIVSMGAAVFVAAEGAPGGSRFSLSAIAALHHLAQAESDDTTNGPEAGNLSEAGAHELTNEGDYLAALVLSKKAPVLIFKHSTSCEVSGGAYRRTAAWLTDEISDNEIKPQVFLVKVIEHKPISEFIAKQTGVKHESPQMILLHDGKAVWNTSHEAITGDALRVALDEVRDSITAEASTD